MADVAEKPTENVADKETVEKPTENTAAEDAVEQAVEATEKTNGANDDKAEKSDANKKPVDKALESSIIRQVEYYFGDANLHRDKFLNDQIAKDPEGWVPLSVLLTFKRLASLSSNLDVIVDAIAKSDEGLLEISEDRTKIRRHPERPIPEHNEERRKEISSRSAYCKGFPLDAKMSDILEFFAPFEKVANISMRKYFDRSDRTYKFKGSIFVTFEKKEQTKDFIEKEGLMYKDKYNLGDRKWQEDYFVMKREERTKIKTKKEKKNNKPEEKPIVLPTGTVLHFEGVTDDSKREVIREAIEKTDPDSYVAYIDFQQGQKEGKIRFQEEGQAAKFLEKLKDNKLTVKEGLEITLRALEKEEEDEFLKQVVVSMKNLRNNKSRFDKGNNRKRRGNFGNRNAKKQRQGGDD